MSLSREDSGFLVAIRSIAKSIGRRMFGDRVGLLIFLITMAAAMLLWRQVISINDNYTVANGLIALSQGRLHVPEATFGPSLGSPGMVYVDGRAYPRNFAHIFLSLPALWVLQAVSVIADLRIAIAGLWSGLLLEIAQTLGKLLPRERLWRIGGSITALIVFGLNAWMATLLVVEHLALLALQLTTIVLFALSAVLMYRILKQLHDQRIGFAAGLAVGLATPGLFWASIPKRHVLTAVLALTTLYFLVLSRDSLDYQSARRYRALAYFPIGITAWLNASEGLVLLIALVIVDLVTAPENSLRTLLTVGAVFVLSLLPMLITNTLVSGDPLTVPRMLPSYATQGEGVRFVGDTVWSAEGGTGGNGGTGNGGTGKSRIFTLIVSVIGEIARPFVRVIERGYVFLSFLGDGVRAIVNEPSKIYYTFFRSGYFGFHSSGAKGIAINLAFLESLPLAGVLFSAPIVLVHRFRQFGTLKTPQNHLNTPTRAADAFLVVYSFILVLLYIPRFPLHAMLTVRYIFPLFPLAIYAVARLPAIQTVVLNRSYVLGFTYAGSVLIGGQVALLVIFLQGYGVDEAMQGFALIGIGISGLLGIWGIFSAVFHNYERVGAVLVGLAAGFTTNLSGLIVFNFFGKGFILPIIPL